MNFTDYLVNFHYEIFLFSYFFMIYVLNIQGGLDDGLLDKSRTHRLFEILSEYYQKINYLRKIFKMFYNFWELIVTGIICIFLLF